MQSSHNKRRDMARSILPSKYRSPGRLITQAKRANRRAIRSGLRAITNDPDPTNDDWDEQTDFRSYPDAEIGWLVRWRRQGDKIAHFERWAVAITKDKPIEDRLSYMQGILPDGLIGDHAMSHLRRRGEFDPHPAYWRYSREAFEKAQRERLKADRNRRRRLGWAVHCAVHDGFHKEINAALKQRGDDEVEPVLLRHNNTHDFVDELYRRGPNGAIIQRPALLRLIDFLDEERYVVASTVMPVVHYAGVHYI